MSKTSRLSSNSSCRVHFCRIGLINSRIIHYFSDQWIDFYIHLRINSLWVTTILMWLCKYLIVTDGSLQGITITTTFPLPINLWIYCPLGCELNTYFIAPFKLRSSNYKVRALAWLRSSAFKQKAALQMGTKGTVEQPWASWVSPLWTVVLFI